MGSLEHRLSRLESRAETRQVKDEDDLSREVLRRMSNEELRRYDGVLERAVARGEPLRALPEDEPIVRRVWEIYEEVRGELAQEA